MAVLEKIRKRSVLLFIIIIGALLAFILGDFLNSGRSLFGPGDTVAKVDNVKVKQMDLNKQSELIENNLKARRAAGQAPQPDEADPDYRYEQALQNALFEKLMNQECERLGIEITDEFISRMVADPSSEGQIMQLLAQEMDGNPQEIQSFFMQYGIVSPSAYLDAINNPSRYRLDPQTAAAMTAAWQQMENSLAQNMQWNLYYEMFSSMLQPNKADAKAYFDNRNNIAKVQMVSVPMSTVNDDEITVEEADLQQVYNRTKEAHRILDETREVAFVVVPIAPSEADYNAATEATTALIADLNTTDGVQALANHKGFNHQNVKLTEENLKRNSQYATLVNDSAGIHKDMVRLLLSSPDSRVVTKVLDITEGIDNVKFSFIEVTDQNQADSLFAQKSSEQVDSIIKVMSGGQFAGLTSSLVNPNLSTFGGYLANMPVIADAIKTAKLNEYVFLSDSTAAQPFSGVLLVTERDQPVKVYELAVMNYDIYPSEQTRQNLTQNLHNYIVNHPTADKFVNDTTGTYQVMYTYVNPNSYSLYNSQMTPNTRGLVKWALDAKKGAVSPVFSRQKTYFARGNQPDETQDYLVAMALVDVYDNYIPYDSQLLEQSIKAQATNDKKAEVLVNKYAGKGKNAAEYGNAMGVTPRTMDILFDAGTIGGAAQGQLAAAKKGDVVGPVQGGRSVYVFQVDEVTTPEFEAADLETRMNEMRNSFRVPVLSPQLLIGNRNVDNNLITYFTASPTAE